MPRASTCVILLRGSRDRAGERPFRWLCRPRRSRAPTEAQQPGSITDDGRFVSFLSEPSSPTATTSRVHPTLGPSPPTCATCRPSTTALGDHWQQLLVTRVIPTAAASVDAPINGDVLHSAAAQPAVRTGRGEVRGVRLGCDEPGAQRRQRRDRRLRVDMSVRAIVTRISQVPGRPARWHRRSQRRQLPARRDARSGVQLGQSELRQRDPAGEQRVQLQR